MKTIRPGLFFLITAIVLIWPGDCRASGPTVPAPAGQSTPSGGGKDHTLLVQARKDSSPEKNRQGLSEAFKWFQKAALKGNKNAQNMIGQMYYDGDGVKRNYEEARSWFEKAAKQNHAEAQYMLGLIHYYGRGVQKNFTTAAQWFGKAAKQQYNAAQYMLGLINYEGKGMKKNLTEAEKWFRQAAGEGDQDAQYMLGLVIYERAKEKGGGKP